MIIIILWIHCFYRTSHLFSPSQKCWCVCFHCTMYVCECVCVCVSVCQIVLNEIHEPKRMKIRIKSELQLANKAKMNELVFPSKSILFSFWNDADAIGVTFMRLFALNIFFYSSVDYNTMSNICEFFLCSKKCWYVFFSMRTLIFCFERPSLCLPLSLSRISVHSLILKCQCKF